jgi:hypothetical protein
MSPDFAQQRIVILILRRPGGGRAALLNHSKLNNPRIKDKFC